MRIKVFGPIAAALFVTVSGCSGGGEEPVSHADMKHVDQATAGTVTGRVNFEGTPPEKYQIEYMVRSLDRGSKKKIEPVPREKHLVEIQLTAEYPRLDGRKTTNCAVECRLAGGSGHDSREAVVLRQCPATALPFDAGSRRIVEAPVE